MTHSPKRIVLDAKIQRMDRIFDFSCAFTIAHLGVTVLCAVASLFAPLAAGYGLAIGLCFPISCGAAYLTGNALYNLLQLRRKLYQEEKGLKA